ncbi:MAG: glycosyltransferase [Elusimicrobia bacterium]|nr:glycosyltransferase [Elusimicrobiota bacterium]
MDSLTVTADELAEVSRILLEGGRAVRFVARGSSMSPIIKDRDTIEVRPAAAGELRKGDVVLYRKDGGLVAHRIVGEGVGAGGAVFLLKADCGEGVETVEWSHILGLVSARLRNGRRLSLERAFPRLLGRVVSGVPYPVHRACYRAWDALRRSRAMSLAARLPLLGRLFELLGRGGREQGRQGPPPKLTVSIVNWNVKGYLEKCLESVFSRSGGLDLEVIVVDNASSDGSAAMVRERFPRVRVIENVENVGYGCGHNQAIGLARGEYVVFLNPDTEMLDDTLPRAARFMDEHPEAGAVMPREIDHPRDKDEAWELSVVLAGWKRRLWEACVWIQNRAPNRWTEGVILGMLARWRGRWKDGYFFASVDYLEGGFVLVRRSALAQVGDFDPWFFLGYEGTDLTVRMKRAGWRLYVLLNVWVIHYGSKSSDLLGDAGVDRLEKEWRQKIERLRETAGLR